MSCSTLPSTDPGFAVDASKKRKLPTQAQRRALLNIAAGRGSAFDVHGRSAHGGHSLTMTSLRRAGLVAHDETLTPAGLEVVASLTTFA